MLEQLGDMPLTNSIVVVMVLGLALYLIDRYVLITSPIKTILKVVLVASAFVWILQATAR